MSDPSKFTVIYDNNSYSFSSSEPVAKYAVSKILLVSFFLLNLILLGSGVTYVVFTLAWLTPSPLLSMIISPLDVFALMVLGCAFISTFFFSLPSLLQSFYLAPYKPFSSKLLMWFNWILVFDMVLVIVGGSIVWWRSLQERNLWFGYWEAASVDMREMLQTTFDCCGYYDACSSTNLQSTLPVCVDPIQAYGDNILTILYTATYAEAAVISLLLLASLSIIAEIRILERYRKIDAKRGKSWSKV